ncbi:glycoside hydrolase family 75 protein [Sulfuriroseicoccus oceanibius]|uniref:Uncharacterized protein n=1 Tax=Sulfuriroseicoccus oceanibius TaxID=2707525 RepID=A0A7T7JBA2_9BACT|nr:glycoside hydrolase family 75 protein [Sulfuriroseicoccus oceanibius]QQL44037.1 hypothetical protein G3M56_009030 [Sulfuriroseicoccus oceanibius]
MDSPNNDTRKTFPRWVKPLTVLAIGGGLATAAGLLALRSPLGAKVARGLDRVVVKTGGESVFPERLIVREDITEVEVPVDGRIEFPGRKQPADVRMLANKLRYEVGLRPIEEGDAANNREDKRAYRVEMNVVVKRPLPATSAEVIAGDHSSIFDAIPGLKELLPSAEVSPFFDQLYNNKEAAIRKRLFDFERMLSRHNYYDCQTILELKHPENGRRALLVQAEMDVVSDGSDGDRLTDIDDEVFSSANYQPTTSYGWRKTTSNENPFMPRIRKRLAKAEQRYAVKGLSAEENRKLRYTIDYSKRLLQDLESRSYLIARYDPFMVLPVFMVTAEAGPFTPRIGDYAAIFVDGVLYPAIVGDAGPNYKMGETSLRMGLQLDERTNPYRRPVSDLRVSYLVFPGTAERPFSAPDYEKWRQAVSSYIDDLGGVADGYPIHQWDDLLAAKDEKPKAEAEDTANALAAPAPEAAEAVAPEESN